MRRLEIYGAIKESYATLLRREPSLFQIWGGWWVIICSLIVNVPGSKPGHIVEGILAGIAAFMGSAAWQRTVLTGAPPFGIGTHHFKLSFSLHPREIRYLIYVVMIWAIAVGGGLCSGAFVLVIGYVVETYIGLVPPHELNLWGYGATLVTLAVFLFLLSRQFLCLPAIAAETPGKVLRQAWALSKGNSAKIVTGLVACTVPPFMALFLFSFFVGYVLRPHIDDPSYLARAVVALIAIALSFVILAVAAAFPAIAYRQLTSGANAPSANEPATSGD